jgi:transcriptional regulator with XRE-family HTH domain
MSRFVDELVKHQGAETGAAFAQRLGISPQFWSDLRRGRRSIPRAFARKLIATWPNLEDAYMEDVREEILGPSIRRRATPPA